MEVTKKKEQEAQGQEGKKPGIDPAIIEELMKGYQRPEDLTGPGGIMEQLSKRLYERVLGAEMTHYLGYEKGHAPTVPAEEKRENHRNGTSKKTLVSEDGKLEIEVPRDRAGEFEPQFVRKGQRRFGGFDSKIIAMYAQGMTVREIKAFLEEQYKVEISADLISTVTDSVLDDVVEWQNRPLEKMYPVVFFDALRVKIRDEGSVKNKAVYLALGIQRDGTKDVLGLWIQQSEGAKFWLAVMNELKHRGLEDILIAVIDGLKGFPEAITAVFAQTQIQTCIVHLIRNSLSFCNWKQRQPVARELKGIYNAETAEVAAKRLEDFATSEWGKKLPAIVQSWRRVWEQVIPFFAYPLEIRKIIYTTNAIESLHMQLRKVLKTRGHFPNDEAATKLIYLALRNITKKWKNPPVTWKLAATQFAIQFGERFFAAETA
ncbi:MAG TPA: IS256 family transposase [Chthoniobacterales bacterium]|jgi:transposase-like protein|nr:IS256 family transposase [Chthoniobacterales bacterium]